MLKTSKFLPLARHFFTEDTLDFGIIPQGLYLYSTMDIRSTNGEVAYLDAQPKDYNGFDMRTLFDDEDPDVDGSIDPNTTSKIYYFISINPYWYQFKYPSGGQITSPYDFYYTDYDYTKFYEKDAALLKANPLSYDTSGPEIVKLVHAKTLSLPIQLSDDTAGFTPVDIFNLDSMTQYFIIENAEKDSLEITTAQCWGNVTFTGAILNRTLPFKLGPGEQVLASMHFEPSTPDSEQHPQTGQMTHFYYDEFVIATDATLGVKFQSNATAGGYKPSRIANPGQPLINWVHPDPSETETAQGGTSYQFEWEGTNVTMVNLEYSYHQPTGVPLWQSITQPVSGTSFDWKLPDTTAIIDIRITPVDQPIFSKIVSLNVTAKPAGSGVTAVTPQHNVQMYPNPVARKLHVSGVRGETVSVLDMLGRNVLQARATGNNATLDCSQLPVGNYIVRIGSEARPVTIAR